MKNTRTGQAGASILGILIIVALLSFFLTVVIRLSGPFMESRTVKTSLESVVESSNSAMPLNEVKKRINANFTTNRVESIDPKAVKVYRDKGKIVIEANYEVRTPLFDGVDAVLIFDTFTYTIQ